ncbi:hypothetical protein GWK47_054841 [Chionoecetes opilio]|uniref:Uncharacterized protein n=1 Tax=Chionoecetes opilio TaxID=41210 RepID=A0A8J4XZG7_CHIOP|nr:hypothetical protein GWK47_054841 [Chionoecetes opilio]
MHRIVTSAPSILMASTGRIGTASSTPTFHLPAVHWLTAKKFLYQRSQSFPTATTRPPVQTSEDIQKKSMKHKIVRSPFHNVSLMIWFGISACRRLPPSCWPPDSKRKIYLDTTCNTTEGMRPTWATSARRKTSCTAEMSPVFLLNSALLNTIREIGDSSLTAVSAL